VPLVLLACLHLVVIDPTDWELDRYSIYVIDELIKFINMKNDIKTYVSTKSIYAISRTNKALKRNIISNKFANELSTINVHNHEMLWPQMNDHTDPFAREQHSINPKIHYIEEKIINNFYT